MKTTNYIAIHIFFNNVIHSDTRISYTSISFEGIVTFSLPINTSISSNTQNPLSPSYRTAVSILWIAARVEILFKTYWIRPTKVFQGLTKNKSNISSQGNGKYSFHDLFHSNAFQQKLKNKKLRNCTMLNGVLEEDTIVFAARLQFSL